MFKLKSLGKSLSYIGALSIVVAFLFASTACEKYTTPNKVEKKLTKGSWKVTTCTYQGVNITPDFVTEALTFTEDNLIKVKSNVVISGVWSTGLNKNPATLNITNFAVSPLDKLNGDWSVLSCTSNTVMLESYNGSLVSNVTLSKI